MSQDDQDDSCWIYNNVKVYDNVCVCGDAEVFDSSALICDDAKVYDNVKTQKFLAVQ